MDQHAEAKALRQRGGTGVADEEADELGSKARLCFRLVTLGMVPVFVLVHHRESAE